MEMPILRAVDLVRGVEIISAQPGERVVDAIEKMSRHNIGSIPVVDRESRLLGIFTERDLVHLLATRGSRALDIELSEAMTRDLVVASREDPVPLIAQKMIKHGVRHIPVVDSDNKLIGIISIRDVLRIILSGSEWP